jgi:hypothetical protein
LQILTFQTKRRSSQQWQSYQNRPKYASVDLFLMDSFNLQVIEDVYKSIPENHPRRIPLFGVFALKLQEQFERTEIVDNLNAVMKANEEAVKSILLDHPDRGYTPNY